MFIYLKTHTIIYDITKYQKYTLNFLINAYFIDLKLRIV
jgi:hypothetical protein